MLLLFIALMVATQTRAALEPEPPHVEYIVSDDAIPLADVMRSNDWKTISLHDLNFGFNPSHYWVRASISELGLSDAHGRWILEAGYPLVDHLNFYSVLNGDVTLEYHSGNNLPYAQRPLDVPTFAFPFDPQQADTLYLYLQTSSSAQLPLTLTAESSFWEGKVTTFAIEAAFYAVLASMLLYNLLISILTRDTLFLYYSCSIASVALMMASLHGWSYAFLWPDSPRFNDLMVLFTISLAEVFTALFGTHYLRLSKISPPFHRVFMLLVAAASAFGIASLFVPYATMIKLLTGLAIVMCISAFLLGIQLWRNTRSRDVMLFFSAISLLLIGLTIYALRNFGVLPDNLLTSRAAELGHIAQIILFALGLADRHNRERAARIAAQDVIISMQRETNAALDRKVKERTADLEMANRRLQEESTTDALTQVRNRRYFDQKFYTLYQEAFRQRTPLTLMLIDIDHFKNFNDQFGHQTGDIVLQRVAREIQSEIKRPLDSVYRYGGEEFAVLLPATAEEGAVTVAEQLRKRIENLQVDTHGELHSITISIGVHSNTPDQREDLDTFYQAADSALYRAKQQGRNCTCLYEDPQNSPLASPEM